MLPTGGGIHLQFRWMHTDDAIQMDAPPLEHPLDVAQMEAPPCGQNNRRV